MKIDHSHVRMGKAVGEGTAGVAFGRSRPLVAEAVGFRSVTVRRMSTAMPSSGGERCFGEIFVPKQRSSDKRVAACSKRGESSSRVTFGLTKSGLGFEPAAFRFDDGSMNMPILDRIAA